MCKKEQELISHYNDCIDELSYLYNEKLEKIKELHNYIMLLQSICNHYGISYPPLEKPITF